MKTKANPLTFEIGQGFTLARLSNDDVEIVVAPELGAKIVSLRKHTSAREWMWRPPGPLRLFRNQPGDDFTNSTLIGADECIPTISACEVNGHSLPDHGGAWSEPWTLDTAAAERGIIRTRLRLGCLPLHLTRSVSLDGAKVRLDYLLENPSDVAQPFLWALHPLLSFEEGDRLTLPEDVRTVVVAVSRQPDAESGTLWQWPSPAHGVDLSHLQLGGDDSYVKFFAGPLSTGRAGIANPRTGDRLAFSWPVEVMPYLGVWLTRGGWKGCHHPAIEPTNAPCDSLADALSLPNSGLFVPPAGSRSWQVTLDLL